MQVCLSLCEVNVLWSCDDADSDVSSTGVKQKWVEEFVIVYEEVKVQPERIG